MDAIIISGTNASGKSTVAKQLTEMDSRFVRVPAITTRPSRTDDGMDKYTYVTDKDYDAMVSSNELMSKTTYINFKYGIRRQDYDAIVSAQKVPVMVLTPDSAIVLINEHFVENNMSKTRVISVFIDADDSTLDIRLSRRIDTRMKEENIAQRQKDRESMRYFQYVVKNHQMDALRQLLVELWNYYKCAGILTGRLIKLMIRSGTLLDNASMDAIQGASYDLSLGDEYYYGGKIHKLSDEDPLLKIEPYDYAIVTSHEIARFPLDMSARFDLSVGLFCQGMILSNGPQVDPGFHGPLFCLLFNTSDSLVILKRRQHYATLEFHKLVEPTKEYEGQYKGKKLLHYLPSNPAQGAINRLRTELDEVRRESQRMQNTLWAVLSFILALIAIWTSLK